MRPNKPINSGARPPGPVRKYGKGRLYSTALPSVDMGTNPPPLPPHPSVGRAARGEKYVGRASVGPRPNDVVPPKPTEWVDPLDMVDEVDLTTITIDLRDSMVDDPPETYYQRHSSRVPGR